MTTPTHLVPAKHTSNTTPPKNHRHTGIENWRQWDPGSWQLESQTDGDSFQLASLHHGFDGLCHRDELFAALLRELRIPQLLEDLPELPRELLQQLLLLIAGS